MEEKPSLVFDLETKYLAEEVGGWSRVHLLGLAAAVVLDCGSGAYLRYTETDVEKLLAHLRSAARIIGYNILRFDFRVLEPYGGSDLASIPSIDLLEHLYQALGFRLPLDAVAEATLGEAKSAAGTQSVTWYRQGEMTKVLDYCQKDVELTWRLYQYGHEHGQVLFRDRSYRLRSVRVAW